jgi:hypothetical protein
VIAFRLIVLVAVWVLGTSALSLAQDSAPEVTPATTEATTTETTTEAESTTLLVPDVRGLPYTFAKGVLEDAGFAWKVSGGVEGFAVNLVATQSAKPGTNVLDTGAPTIVLTLEPNPDYPEEGLPEDSSPYPGTKLVLAAGGDPKPASVPEDEPAVEEPADADATAEPGQPAVTDTEPAVTTTEPATATEPAETEPSGYEPAAATDPDANADADVSADGTAADRPPAFVVPGAPEEPLDELPLPQRARKLAAWVEDLKKLTPDALDHFTYQHAWVVTGASFGWWRGAEALRILIAADERFQKRFSAGADAEAEARSTLREVERRTKGA